MTPKSVHYLKLLTLVATLWVLYLVPRPTVAWLEPLKPTAISLAFTILAHRLRVASWPVVVAFSLTFFAEGVAEAYINGPATHETPSGNLPDDRVMMLALWAALFSPVSLWGPILFSVLAYIVLRRPPALPRRDQ